MPNSLPMELRNDTYFLKFWSMIVFNFSLSVTISNKYFTRKSTIILTGTTIFFTNCQHIYAV